MLQSLTLVDALFLLDGRSRREEKKKRERETTMEEEGFPRAGPALLAVLRAAAGRYN
jgi:hypothetical protein